MQSKAKNSALFNERQTKFLTLQQFIETITNDTNRTSN